MTHLDLFSGIGGFSLAARWVGWETVAQVEWDKWCQKVLAKNFPDALRFGDIKQFNDGIESFFTNGKCLGWTEGAGQNLQQQEQITKRQDIGNFCKEIRLRGRINIITGGFPCQPFSHAGKRQGVADERYLWPEMLRTIRILKPSFVVGENVAGLVSMDNGKTLDAILADLENEGYQVESFIIPACAVGAWHRRDRIWIIGHRNVSDTECSIEGQDGRCVRINGKGRTTLQTENKGREGQTVQYRKLDDVQRNVTDSYNGRFEEQRCYKSIQPNIERKTESIELEYTSSCNGQKPKARTRQSESQLGGMVTRLPLELDGYWDRELEGIPRVATGVKNRIDRLKGLGNAIVPQVAYQIFKAIEQSITIQA